ncbi:MAG: hypothetical protein E7599_07205 [Ruminococcaceae bacterium]|nr:hypothetical protein [Oscillospiraceae bacterium]
MNVKMSTERLRAHFKEVYARLTHGSSREDLLRSLGKGALLTVYTFLLASTEGLFETLPFALSLLCAIPERIAFAYTGAMAAAVFGRGFSPAMSVAYTVIFLWRTQVSRFFSGQRDAGRTEEPTAMRCMLSAAVALGVTSLPMIGNFTYYGLFGAFFMVIACPCLTLLFSGAYLVGRTSPLYSSAGKCLLYFCLVLSCKEFSLFGFTPALAVAAFVTVLEFTSGTPVESCFLGFFSALAIDLGSAVMLAAVALVGGVVHHFNHKISVGAGLLAGMAYAFAVMGSSALFSVFPDLVCAGLLAVPVVRTRGQAEPMTEEKTVGAAGQYLDEREKQQRQAQEQQTVESMHRLSGLFYALGQNRIPDGAECQTLCDAVEQRRCGRCRAAAYCRAEHGEQRELAFQTAATALQREGRLDGRFLLGVGCMYSAEIAEELTSDYAVLCRTKSEPNPAAAYAVGFEAVSKLLCEQKEYRKRSRMPRGEYAGELSRRARQLGLSFSTVGVYGFLCKTVFFCNCKALDCRGGAEGLRKVCQEVLGGRMSYPRIVISKGDYAVILESLPAYSLEHAQANKPKPGQKHSGDSIGSFSDADGNPCLLLCDGMGSGSRAAIASGLGCSLSECLSGAGATPKLITELLNAALCHRKEEDSCTFDLFCFDRYTGGGTFIKSGAAPTLIFRKGSAYNLSSSNLPLGTVADAQSEQMRMQMSIGDLVILASDGVASDFEDTAVLASIISGHEEDTVSDLAERILSRCSGQTKQRKDPRKCDDMSICVIRINAAEETNT